MGARGSNQRGKSARNTPAFFTNSFPRNFARPFAGAHSLARCCLRRVQGLAATIKYFASIDLGDYDDHMKPLIMAIEKK